MLKQTGWVTWAVILVSALAIYFLVVVSRSGDSEIVDEKVSIAAYREASATAGHEALEDRPGAVASRSSPPKLPHPLESGYRWDPNNPGIAESQQDAAWLEANGYPGPDVEAYLMSLPVYALKNLADRDNKPAQAFYAFRLAQSGADQSDTQEVLLKSAASGSIFALKMAGDIYYTVDGYRDPVMASVFYGLQARRGDHAGLIQNYLVDSALTSDQRLRAQALRELAWINMGKMPSQGRRYLDFSPRPGFVPFLERALLPPSQNEP